MSETWNAVAEEKGEDDEDEESKSNETCGKDQASITSGTVWDGDLIDISGIDLEDEETWLLQSSESKLSFWDLRSWLRGDFPKNSISPNRPINDNNALGSSIDTRTFTRCKKKMAKLNFNSMREPSLPAVVHSDSETSWGKMRINWREEEARNEDSIPAMLRQSLPSTISNVNPQESLEAFLDMSQSKGIDSFINMAEPEFNESLMNISRPSFLQSTISNHSMHSTCGTTNSGMTDSQILTDSMMQTSMFSEMGGDINDSNFSEERNWLDSSGATILKNISVTDGDRTFTSMGCQEVISNIDNQQVFPVNKTFNRLPSLDSPQLSNTITVDESPTCFNTIEEETNCNRTFCSNNLISKISLNSTFKTSGCRVKNYIIEQEEEMSSNSTYVAATDDEIISSEEQVAINCPNSFVIAQNDEPQSLDMTYSKRDFMTLNESIDIIKLAASKEEEVYKSQSDVMPVNRYQTYRKPPSISKIGSVNKLANSIGKIPLNYDENYRGKSMEILDKLSSGALDSQQIYTKLNGPKSLSRLPQTLQKSNPNLRSHNSTFAKSKSTMISQSKFGFQSGDRGRIVNNGQPMLSNRLGNLGKVQRVESEKMDTRNSNESIASTLSTFSGPDFDDCLSTCSDGSHPLNSEKITSSELYRVARIHEEKFNQESTPKADRKILENTWMASSRDLPSPILKQNEMINNQVGSNDDLDTVIKTSSPIISPGGSLQSIPQNQVNVVDAEKAVKKDKGLPLNKLTSVFKPPQNLENKTDGVRLPAGRSSNLPSGIPRPASRIPAPRFSRTNAQVKSQNNLKKGLF